MKITIKIAFVVVGLIVAALITAMFTKDSYTLVKAITINRSNQEVYNYIKMYKNQKAFSKWLSMDPDTKINYRGIDGTPGFVLAFDSKDERAGKGEQEIKRLVQNERVEFELRFLEPFEFVANGKMETFSLAENQTKVTWVYNSGMKYPMNFMLLFLDMDNIIGKDLEESLRNLKVVLEEKAPTSQTIVIQ
jgi:uncharacterized protein YndB with AHSA1/START domain